MIESISIKNVASYNDAGINITELKKVNFIYGANGCGKTTISNLLLNPNDVKFQACSVKWKNSRSLNTLVYNKEFREQNFGKGKINGIFTLGQATSDEIKIINDKKEKLDIIKNDGSKIRETLEIQDKKLASLEDEFKEACWTDIYKKYDPIFKEAFVGSLNKESFKNKLLQEFVNNTSILATLEELKTKAKTIFGKIPQNISLISTIDYKNILDILKDASWKKTIVGNADVDIAKLIQKLNISDWVNQGRSYLQDDEICPFCQHQSINNSFKKQLEDFFDESYLSEIENLKSLSVKYSSLTQKLITELNSIETAQKKSQDTTLDLDRYSVCLKTLYSQNTSNLQLQKNKIKEPSSNVDLVSLEEQLDLIAELITNANVEIKKHNDIVINFTIEKNNLITAIWKFIIEEFNAKIVKFNSEKIGLTRGINTLNTRLKAKRKDFTTLDTEIKQLSKNVTSIQPTINEINRLLKSYGFLNFEIMQASEKGFYQIQRDDGTIAESTLSDGEITFITLLYYLQLAKGGTSKDNVNEDRILIIDDPISSLDSSVLFIVSTLIKEIIKKIKTNNSNIKQIILLTHNVYFHKEVSYEGLNRKVEKSLFWILRKSNKLSAISFYSDQNPILSSYELLWREIKEWNKNSGITIQNAMRRILENYFNILGNKRDDALINAFPNQEEKEICRSLLSWANEGSHTLPDDLFIEAPDEIITNYLKVFESIFKHTNNMGHYYMMMGIEQEENLDKDNYVTARN